MSNARTISNLANQIVNIVNKGADRNGVLSASTIIQNELNRLAALGGGKLIVPSGKFRLTAPITIPLNVTLAGDGVGPYESTSNPATSPRQCPILLVDHNTGPAITLNAPGAGVTDILFWYPGQVGPSATTPVVFPPTIRFAEGTGSQKVLRCTFGNSYDGIEILSGRSTVENCLIGAFHNDISVDVAYDWVHLNDIQCQVMWNGFAGALPFPQPIDTWVMNNSIALKTGRVDSLTSVGFSVYGRHTGHRIIDSPNTSLSVRCGYGRISNVDFDYVAYGIDATSTISGAFGFQYTNVAFGANGSGVGQAGQAAVRTRAGGTQAPIISVVGGHCRGVWAVGALPPTDNAGYNNGGRIYCSDVRNLNMYGQVSPTTANPPASGVQTGNFYPYAVDVYLVDGTITGVTHNGVDIGTARMIRLQPYEALAISYSSAPTWKWFAT